MDAQEAYLKLVAYGTQAFGLRLRYKQEVWWWRWLVKVVGPLESVATTLGYTVYLPSRAWFEALGDRQAVALLAHELVHMADRKRLGWKFYLLYTWPQCLAVLAALAVFRWEWLLCLAFLLPWRALGRYKLELRGYTMSLAVEQWMSHLPRVGAKAKAMSGPTYYYMAHNACAFYDLSRALDSIRAGSLLEGGEEAEVFRQVHAIVKAGMRSDA